MPGTLDPVSVQARQQDDRCIYYLRDITVHLVAITTSIEPEDSTEPSAMRGKARSRLSSQQDIDHIYITAIRISLPLMRLEQITITSSESCNHFSRQKHRFSHFRSIARGWTGFRPTSWQRTLVVAANQLTNNQILLWVDFKNIFSSVYSAFWWREQS